MSQTTPQRIQRKRERGWRMPEGAIYVGRGSRWGNQFKIVIEEGGGFLVQNKDGEVVGQAELGGALHAHRQAVAFYRASIGGLMRIKIRNELAGKVLCCWCPPELPCHADVLLEIANG